MIIKEEFPALLDAGIHGITLDGLRTLCVDKFPNSACRGDLFHSLISYISQIQQLGLNGSAWIDGSFMTQKENPGDIDVVLLLNEPQVNSLDATHAMALKALINNATVKQRYNLDLYLVSISNTNLKSYWRGWFGYYRDGRTAKGIAEVTL